MRYHRRCRICKKHLYKGVSGILIHRRPWGRRCIRMSQSLWWFARNVWLGTTNASLNRRLGVYLRALSFYASTANYSGSPMGTEWVPAIEVDKGDKARRAMEEQ